MTEEGPTTTGTRKRRTSAEIKADLARQIAEIDAEERLIVYRDLSDAHERIREVSTREHAKAHLQALNEVLRILGTVVAVLTPPKPPETKK